MLNRYWNLNGTGITSNVTFHYISGAPPAGDIPATATEAQFNIFRILGTGQAIRVAPNGTSTILNTVNHTFTVMGLNNFSLWTAGNPLAPTAAPVTVSGRVVRPDGLMGVHSIVTITDDHGNVRYSMTNPFGYFRFDGVESGQNYVINVIGKQFEFAPQFVSVNDNLTDLVLTLERRP